MRKGLLPALVAGLALAFACLGAASLDYFTGVEYVPLRVVGLLGGLCAMLSLHAYQRIRPPAGSKQKGVDHPMRAEVWRSFSPWIVLTTLAAVVSVPQIGEWLSNLPGNVERIVVAGNPPVDLDFFSQIYTWIFVAILISLFTLRVTKQQAKTAFKVWLRRSPGPFLAFGLYFCMAFVMNSTSMNVILGETLASVFGAGYVFVAASLGLFGAIVGGSETTSNVLFHDVQKTATGDIGLNEAAFMTVYGSHAVAGGIASAVTPAKINNAVVTIDAGRETESVIMRKHLVVAVLLTIATGIMTGVLVNLGI